MKLFLSLFSTLLFISLSADLFAQQRLPVPLNIQKTYDQGIRNTDGTPGPNYWQNTADYDMNVHFDPPTRLVSGAEEIIYTNNSPDTLNRIVFKLYPNLFKKGSPRAGTIESGDVGDGVTIKSLHINGTPQDINDITIDATNMIVKTKGVQPQEKIKFDIEWEYELNENSPERTGQMAEGSYFIAYFFPRVAVYDDVDGWNYFQYNGLQEFYNDFSNFDVKISVPKDYVVWATGDLLNAETVLNKKQVDLLNLAEKSDEIIRVISQEDLDTGNITADKTNTWHFKADNIVDFTFGTSDHYLWESTSVEVDPHTKRRTRVDAVYAPHHKDYEQVIGIARKTVEVMSYDFPAWPFPYPHITVFDGLEKMEYPMMVNDVPIDDFQGTAELTVHEIFHTMLPFYMGINETKYSFMDEGWATLAEWLIPAYMDPQLKETDDFGISTYNIAGGSEMDLPIMIPSTAQSGSDYTEGSYFLNSYPKPALGYLYVKDLLGDELFTKTLHLYFERWNGKHPLPWDFFNSINEGAGQNLNWFWKRWFFDGGFPDLAIEDVQAVESGYEVVVKSIGNKPVPVDLTLHFTDGSTQQVHQHIGVWKDADKTSLFVPSDKKLKKVELGAFYNADVNLKNNVFKL